MSVYAGLDVGGTSIKCALVSDTGELLKKWSFDTKPERGFETVCEETASLLRQNAQEAGIPWEEIRGIGVGIPGFLDVEEGVVIEAVNLGWKDVKFAPLLAKIVDKPVVLENDANLAALGESWTGAGRGAKSALCVTVGTGVGAGIVLDGRLYRGVNGMAGEVGHLTVKLHDGYRCNCGKLGCLETEASATAIIREAKRAQAEGKIPAGATIHGAEDVFALASAGNQAAREVVEEAARFLGYGLALCAITLNPDAIVVGGGVSKAGDLLMDPVRRAFAEYALPLVVEGARLVPAELGNDAGVFGAARLAMQASA